MEISKKCQKIGSVTKDNSFRKIFQNINAALLNMG